jgi:hypothetical protein
VALQFPRPADLDVLQVYNGPTGVGLVPISETLMYMYVTTPEPDNPRYPREGLAAAMRGKLGGTAPPSRRWRSRSPTTKAWSIVRWKA